VEKIGTAFGEITPIVKRFVEEKKVETKGKLVNRWFKVDESANEFNLCIGFFVTKESVPSLDGTSRIKLEEVKGGKYAKVQSNGDYSNMQGAWRKLKAWGEGGKLDRRDDGLQWEHFLVGMADTTDKNKFVTEIFWKLEDSCKKSSEGTLSIGHLTIVCHNQDDAIKFYTEKLGFKLATEHKMPNGFRWISLTLDNVKITLMLATNEEQKAIVGKQSAGYVLAVIETNNFDKAYQRLKENGVEFTQEPRDEFYGKVVVFKDLYGNLFDLIQIKPH